MSWQLEIPIIVRSLINDLGDNPTYSDERIQQLIVVSAQYVTREVNLHNEYNINIINPDIIPDPTLLENKDLDFISFIGLKSACLLDQSSLRTRAASEGVKAGLGPATISIGQNGSYQFLLLNGPCKTYEDFRIDYEIGNTSLLRGILSPFVGNNFDPSYLRYPGDHIRDIYS
jgi:hypothetical protein